MGDELHCRVWERTLVPSPWCENLTKDMKIENKKCKANGGNMPSQDESSGETVGNSQQNAQIS